MGVTDEEWVQAAMADDAIVVELLVRLHHSPPPPRRKKPAAFPLHWSVRQRRSKSVSVSNNPKKPAHRGSPTTPLSWSSATTFSGGGCLEESSRPTPFKLSNTTTRSKVNIDGEKTVSKRSRKKKTLAELKSEESSLLKERRELKREMAALRMNLERQRAKNDNFKRMKVELLPRLDQETTTTAKESISSQLLPESTSALPIPPLVSCDNVTLQSSTLHPSCEENTEPSDSKFVLPDLNIPFDQAL